MAVSVKRRESHQKMVGMASAEFIVQGGYTVLLCRTKVFTGG